MDRKYQGMDRKYQKLFHPEWQQVKCRAVTTETKAWHLKLWRRGTFAILFLLFPCFWKIKTLSSGILGRRRCCQRRPSESLCALSIWKSPRGGSVWIAVGAQKCYTKHIEWESKSVLQALHLHLPQLFTQAHYMSCLRPPTPKFYHRAVCVSVFTFVLHEVQELHELKRCTLYQRAVSFSKV